MPAGLDFEDGLVGHLGAAIALPGGEFGQGAQDINLGEDGPRLDQPGGVGGHPIAEGGEEFIFEGVGPVLGVPDLVLVFLQLGRDVVLGVLDGLLADVVAGDLGRCRSGRG